MFPDTIWTFPDTMGSDTKGSDTTGSYTSGCFQILWVHAICGCSLDVSSGFDEYGILLGLIHVPFGVLFRQSAGILAGKYPYSVTRRNLF